MTVVAVLIGVLVGGGNVISFPVIIACVSAFLIVAGGFVINDFFDRDIDAANNRDRPIPKCRIQPESAKIFGYLLLSMGVIIVWITGNLAALFIAITGAFLLHLYSYTIKPKNAILGNIVTSYSTAITFIYGWSLIGNLSIKIIVILPFVFAIVMFASMAREFMKGIYDINGDRQFKLKTAALRLGIDSTASWITILMLFAVVLSPIPYMLQVLGVGYISLMVVVDILSLWACFSLLRFIRSRKYDEKSIIKYAGKTKNLFLGAMSLGIIAIGLGLYF
jgi:geranylgeranylglycerol-phosphate geranylgeranyltransferase